MFYKNISGFNGNFIVNGVPFFQALVAEYSHVISATSQPSLISLPMQIEALTN